MLIQVNSDKNISTPENFITFVQDVINEKLIGVKDHVTRVEVHLSDENAGKFGINDKRCVMEARVEGRKPTAITNHADNLHDVVEGAAKKLKHSLESIIDKNYDKHRS